MSDDFREVDDYTCGREECSCTERDEEKSSKDDSSGCSPLGCFSISLIVLAFWALVFGVTVGGKHYGVAGCDTEHGVKLDTK